MSAKMQANRKIDAARRAPRHHVTAKNRTKQKKNKDASPGRRTMGNQVLPLQFTPAAFPLPLPLPFAQPQPLTLPKQRTTAEATAQAQVVLIGDGHSTSAVEFVGTSIADQGNS